MTDTCGDMESVRRLVKSSGWHHIGVDGIDSASREQLALALSLHLKYPMLDVDDYVHSNQGGYIDFIDYPALRTAISTMPALILSGLCLQEVLANMGMTLDGVIYIKRMQGGSWMDEELCVFPDGVEAALEEINNGFALNNRLADEQPEFAGEYGADAPPFLLSETLRYHDNYRPDEAADLVFEREQENES